MRFVIWTLVNAVALAAATWLLSGITLTGDDRQDRIVSLLIVALFFGLINAFVRPVVQVLSFPLIILTMGLLLPVINALMLLLTSRVSESLELGFKVDGFWTALFGSIIISITSAVLMSVFPED